MELEKYTNHQKQIIKDTHMKHRCWVIFAMCILSIYNWYHYSLFETPYINDISKPYYWNCLIFISYLLWDTYKMVFSEHKTILYRTDLLLHHFVTIMVYLHRSKNLYKLLYFIIPNITVSTYNLFYEL